MNNLSLKQLRLLAGLTQKEAARLIGVSPVSLCKWESGVFKPTPDKREKLASIYNVSISTINDTINKGEHYEKLN